MYGSVLGMVLFKTMHFLFICLVLDCCRTQEKHSQDQVHEAHIGAGCDKPAPCVHLLASQW